MRMTQQYISTIDAILYIKYQFVDLKYNSSNREPNFNEWAEFLGLRRRVIDLRIDRVHNKCLVALPSEVEKHAGTSLFKICINASQFTGDEFQNKNLRRNLYNRFTCDYHFLRK